MRSSVLWTAGESDFGRRVGGAVGTRVALNSEIRNLERCAIIPLVDSISGAPGCVHRADVVADTCIDNAGQHRIAASFLSSPSQTGKEVSFNHFFPQSR